VSVLDLKVAMEEPLSSAQIEAFLLTRMDGLPDDVPINLKTAITRRNVC